MHAIGDVLVSEAMRLEYEVSAPVIGVDDDQAEARVDRQRPVAEARRSSELVQRHKRGFQGVLEVQAVIELQGGQRECLRAIVLNDDSNGPIAVQHKSSDISNID